MAVYTQVPPEALDRFLAAYDLAAPPLAAQPPAAPDPAALDPAALDLAAGPAAPYRLAPIAEGVENSNFRLATPRGDYILTLFERRVRASDLPWFLGLMTHLAAHGVPCPLPVPGTDGQALRQLCGRGAVVTTFLPGAWPRAPEPAHCAAVGTALAGLHRAGEGFAPARANTLGPAAWRPLLAATPQADSLLPGLAAELGHELTAVLGAWPDALPGGHIHADLFPDNVFFDKGRLSGLIDFYFAATDFLAYDLAVSLTAWCFGPDGAFHPDHAHAMTGGYDAVRPLTDAERRVLPTLVRGASLRFLLTRLYDWLHTPHGALVTRKDPREFLARARTQRTLGSDAYLG